MSRLIRLEAGLARVPRGEAALIVLDLARLAVIRKPAQPMAIQSLVISTSVPARSCWIW